MHSLSAPFSLLMSIFICENPRLVNTFIPRTESILTNTLPSPAMSLKIVPNKLGPLTYYILDNCNAELTCEGCHKTWSPDGTAFMRDQGGSKNGMYYRQFRCKGKSKGACSASYTHEDFLALATRQLGQKRIDKIKSEISFGTTPSAKRSIVSGPSPPRKRAYSTKFTP